MKKLVYFIILLLAATMAYASLMPAADTVFTFKRAACFSNGIMEINVTHEGLSVRLADINMTVENEFLTPRPLIGAWYRGGYPTTNYERPFDNVTGQDFVSKLWLTYRTDDLYTKGDYIITLSWPSNTIYYDHIKFAVQCPGIICDEKTNLPCTGDQKCINKVCEWFKCNDDQIAIGNTCMPRCNDYNVCTKDYYIDGQCIYVKKEGCCNIDDDCNDGFRCDNKQCALNVPQWNIFSRFWYWLKSRYQ